MRRPGYGTWCCLLLASGASSLGGARDGTGFTYQGQLKKGGVPAEGPHNLVFRLFADGNTQVGGDLSRPRYPVVNGLFSVELDFGPGAFDGAARELEVEVEGVVLSPRQRITPAPYAMYALEAPSGTELWVANGADIHNTSAGNVGVGTDQPTAKLHIGGASGVDGIRFPDGTLQTTAAPSSDGLTLPFAGSHFGVDEIAFSILETGTGHAGSFNINNVNTSWAALFSASNGLAPALHAVQTHGWTAAQFENTAVNNAIPTVLAISNGSGAAIQGTTRPGMNGSGVLGHSDGNGNGVEGSVNGSGNAIQGTVTNNTGRAAYFEATSAGNVQGAVLIESAGTSTSKALRVDSTGAGDAVYAEIQNPSSDGEAVEARTDGTGNAIGALHSGTEGHAGFFLQNHGNNTTPAVEIYTLGLGPGLHVEIGNTLNDSEALHATTRGDGPAILATTSGKGLAAELDGDVKVSGTVMMGYEITSDTSFDSNTALAACPSGKNVIGGGCACAVGTLTQSWPFTIIVSGWQCACSSGAVQAYAICANIR